MRERPVELLRALAVLGEAPTPEHARVAEALGLGAPPTADAYADVFLFHFYPYASVYLGPEGMMGGEAEARIAGFWQAVGREAPKEPDHVSALVGLYADLVEAGEAAEDAEAALHREAAKALLHEHLAPWLLGYLEKVHASANAFYAEWAALLKKVVEAEIAYFGPAEAPTSHAQDTPALADPREGEPGAFVAGLLAPAVSGFVLTRTDLGVIARALGLGLRAGERRYALEHLLGVDAAGVLGLVAEAAEREAAAHAGRAEMLGASAVVAAERARRTAALCRALATEAAADGEGVAVSDLVAGVTE